MRWRHARPIEKEQKVRFNKQRRKTGFSLIEVMIAVVIVGAGVVSIYTLLIATRMHNSAEQERTRAHHIVSEEMDRVRLELFTRITPGSTVTIWDNGTPADLSDDTLGTITVTMWDAAGTQLASAPTTAQRLQVEVTISWNPRGSRSSVTNTETVMGYLSP